MELINNFKNIYKNHQKRKIRRKAMKFYVKFMKSWKSSKKPLRKGIENVGDLTHGIKINGMKIYSKEPILLKKIK